MLMPSMGRCYRAPHAADVIEHGRPVVRRMLNEPDGVLGSADQSGEPSLALEQRQVAQVIAVMLDQVESVQHRLMTARSAVRAQRVSGRRLRAPASADL